ncbi:MAG: NADH oxidoreductase (quinone) subunit F [Deltaproteobacteria bacterium RIFCSPLOWO2_12_FULL_38_8]|nr:MAG: NADH oxidoreductase (quinone) subunit F [Deltaproteobacteria bacterium RIFCSPLOWO2_12_FULL_38_8]
MTPTPKIVFQNLHIPNIKKLAVYREHGGYTAAQKVLKETKPEDIITLVKNSGLRGRGGAGFGTGMKWSFVPKDAHLKYLLCNADEGEPGTFKDRILMEQIPHSTLEGMIIACYAIQCPRAYIYVRGEYTESIEALEAAIQECTKNNFLGKNIFGTPFSLDIHVFKGAGAYICGEETGLVTSMEGAKGQPKVKPPFPAISGFNKKPTVINNVETLAVLPWIILNGADNYKKIGTEKSPGTKLFCLSGPVKNPGTYELPLGFPLKDLIYDIGGGLTGNLKLKAVIPGGLSAPVLTAEETMTMTMDFESLAKVGSMLGSGGVIVIANDQCMVDLLSVITYFYKHESCGQCTPCREGTGWMKKVVDSILHQRGRAEDIPLLQDISTNMMGGRTICALSDAAAMPVKSFVTKFKQEFEYHIKNKRCHL